MRSEWLPIAILAVVLPVIFTADYFGPNGIYAIIVIAGLALYFAPTLNAMYRRHTNTAAIFFLNLFLGWTFIGWVAALVWSATRFKEN